MKPQKIDWVTHGPLGPFPDEGRELLLSYRSPFLYGDTDAKSTEGFYKLHGGGFIDRNGENIIGVYAWAYKPDCMLGRESTPSETERQEVSYNEYLEAVGADDNNTYARKIYERLIHNGFTITRKP